MGGPAWVDFQPNVLFDLENLRRRRSDAQRRAATATGRHQAIPVLAEIGALDDAPLDPPAGAIAGGAAEPDALRPHREDHAPPEFGNLGKAAGLEGEARKADRAAGERAFQEVRAADEAGDEARARAVVEREGVVDLLDPALVHYHDAVGGHHRFRLVVGDVDGGDAEPIVEPSDLEAHLLAQIGV